MSLAEQVSDRFKALVAATRRDRPRQDPPAPPTPVDPEAPIKAALGSWVKETPRAEFDKWLCEQMEKAIVSAHANHLILTESTYVLGYEAGMRYVRDCLRRWAK